MSARQRRPPNSSRCAFRSWDIAALERLRGTFAIALWDTDRRRGVLATDHFALRPWYVAPKDRALLAATSMRALVRMLPTEARTRPDHGRHVARRRPCAGRGDVRSRGRAPRRCPRHRLRGRPRLDPALVAARYQEPLRASRTELAEQLRASLGDAIAQSHAVRRERGRDPQRRL